MPKINDIEDLDEQIARLEDKLPSDKAEIQRTYQGLLKSINPMHMISELISEVVTEPDLKEDFIQAVSVSSGFLANKLIVRKSKSAPVKLMGSLAQYGLTMWLSHKLHQKTTTVSDSEE